MLKVVLLTVTILILVVVFASIGVIFKRDPIKGSCGGLSALGFEKACSCKEPCDACNSEGEEDIKLAHKSESQAINTDYVDNKVGEGKFKA